MHEFIDRHTFLRLLNYLRVRHPFSRQYNIIYPLILLLCFGVLDFFYIERRSYFGSDGVIDKLSSFLAVTTPFYLAALAAVSTFGRGHKVLDRSFNMSTPVELSMFVQGHMVQKTINPRHFLSLLFGYCCVVSFALFSVSILAPLVSSQLMIDSTAGRCLEMAFFYVFLFLLLQVGFATLLGVYYLADKLHRED